MNSYMHRIDYHRFCYDADAEMLRSGDVDCCATVVECFVLHTHTHTCRISCWAFNVFYASTMMQAIAFFVLPISQSIPIQISYCSGIVSMLFTCCRFAGLVFCCCALHFIVDVVVSISIIYNSCETTDESNSAIDKMVQVVQQQHHNKEWWRKKIFIYLLFDRMSFRLLVTHISNAHVSWIYSLWRAHRTKPKSAHPVRTAKHEQENPKTQKQTPDHSRNETDYPH